MAPSIGSQAATPIAPVVTQKCRKITIAVDHHPHSEYAVQWALDTILQPNDKLSIIHVQEKPDLQFGLVSKRDDEPLPAEVIESIKTHQSNFARYITSKFKKLCEARGVQAETGILIGDPREQLCSFAKESGTDMLVMGSRGLSNFKKTFLGSVSDYVSQHCSRPVLVVKADPTSPKSA